MISDELGDKIVAMAEELMNEDELDTVQIIVTQYDPIKGKTSESYTGLGNIYSRKGILEALLDHDLEFADEDESEDDEEGFGETD